MPRVRRTPHENVATVLVDPRVLGDLELALMALDLRVWPIGTAPICLDGPRMAFQVRRSLLIKQRGEWDLARPGEKEIVVGHPVDLLLGVGQHAGAE